MWILWAIVLGCLALAVFLWIVWVIRSERGLRDPSTSEIRELQWRHGLFK